MHFPTSTALLTTTLLMLFSAFTASAAAVPPRNCDPGDVVNRFPCESAGYEALEFTRGPGDRYYQCCEKYGVYLARLQHLSMDELESAIRQW